MSYPRVTLQITDNAPTIIYMPEQGVSRDLISDKENLEEVVSNLANQLSVGQDLKGDSEKDLLTKLVELSYAEGDEGFIDDLPKFDIDDSSFDLALQTKLHLAKLLSEATDFEAYSEASDEVKAELKKNQNLDMFANLLELIYNILIARTLTIATDLGIGKIALSDSTKNLRLHQIMNRELKKLGLELLVD